MKNISEIIELARQGKGGAIAVAAAHDADVLKAAVAAAKENIAIPIFVGKSGRISEILTQLGESPDSYNIISAETDEQCAALAVQQVRDGKADFLMKGLMPTSLLMREVVSRESGLRTGRLLSHIMVYEVPGYDRLLVNTDGGMVTAPDLEKKAGILENAAVTLKALGYGRVNAACVCGAEFVDPKIQATVDAEALCGMTDIWDKYDMNVYGPVGLDLAISEEACRHKGYRAEGAGKADIILVPAYEVGNGIGKALTYFAGAKSAGLIVGAKVPIVLVSRSDTAETKLASIAFGAAVSRRDNA